MPEIAMFGKFFYLKDPAEAKSSAEMQQRYTIATAVDRANRWENRRAQTRVAKRFARAPFGGVADAAGQIPLGQNRARQSQCGRKANGKLVFHQM